MRARLCELHSEAGHYILWSDPGSERHSWQAVLHCGNPLTAQGKGSRTRDARTPCGRNWPSRCALDFDVGHAEVGERLLAVSADNPRAGEDWASIGPQGV